MQLVLIRHGQSVNNANYSVHLQATAGGRQQKQTATQEGARIAEEVTLYPKRVPDPVLTDLGSRQAGALAAAQAAGRLPFTPTHLYASPMLRAVQTARPLSAATGLPVLLLPDAHEVGGVQQVDPITGERTAVPGATLEELRRHGGDVVPQPGVFPAAGRPWHGGFEPELEAALPRARRVLSGLLGTHRHDDVVALVSHQFFAQFLLAAALGWDSPPWRRFRVDNTGHVSLRMEHGEAVAEWVNRVDHLAPADVSN
ncbi:histidine phosphatase family protein [Kineosporia sp. J2-2]|uniref:Histidine phosphatase family protein n=1 Tax=Kineosporia corallincola TaxID=2835133 RepID=A0ABS5TLH9_9ACTN|nr:histidine phosphatase family protein [Kineosporia corallincola]MBT0771960.1 histidine phosphatase family protein [Kineosporia corallincola]